jgi:hypothetical protein
MRSLRVSVAILLTLSLSAVVPGQAFAQVPPPPSDPAADNTRAQPQPQELTEAEKEEKAKSLYVQAEGLAAQDRWTEAVPLYEDAYYLVPGKHGFAHKVGVAAWRAGDCNKANEYLKHFLTYADPEKLADKFDEAKQILGEISVSGCATEDTSTTTTATKAEPTDVEVAPGLGESTTEIRQTEAKKARDTKKDEKRGLLIGGAVLTGVGVVGVSLGIAGLAIANSSANTLRSLSSNATITGFPVGDYSCRNVGPSECPADLERRMRTGNALGYVGLGVGGAALAGGVAMLAIYMVSRKRSGGLEQAAKSNDAGVQLSGLGPMLVPGGGGGAMVEVRF